MSGISVAPLSLSRDSSGRLVYNFQDNAEDIEIGNVGTISGEVSMVMGSNDAGDTVIGFDNSKGIDEYSYNSKIVLSNTDGQNFAFNGGFYDVSAVGGNANRSIQMNTVCSELDLSATSGVNAVTMTENSMLNETQLGLGNNIYIDQGYYNTVTSKGGNQAYATTETSEGAVIIDGSGNSSFVIAGKLGIFDAGAGNDSFFTNGYFGENDGYSYRNIMLGGDGDDVCEDKGGHNIFFGESGNDTYYAYGYEGLANLGFADDEADTAIFGATGTNNHVFDSEEQTTNQGFRYSYSDILKRFEWSDIDAFLDNPEKYSAHQLAGTKDLVYDRLYALFLNNYTGEDAE